MLLGTSVPSTLWLWVLASASCCPETPRGLSDAEPAGQVPCPSLLEIRDLQQGHTAGWLDG